MNELNERISQHNWSRIYQLKKAFATLVHGDDIVITFYGKLKVIWDGLSLFDHICLYAHVDISKFLMKVSTRFCDPISDRLE